MIIRAIRLKNIKSYGEGPDGDGVTIRFQPGVNRIAGRNGHGKSTLIEALGYAMFSAEPPCLESFDLTTYFLRAGCKAGEIDITFSHGPETYRVERGLGPSSKRRAKVVLVDDGSICAEDEREVSGFLCRLLGFPDPRRLADVFLKLLGVKQGHLTRPFDSKPGQAKDFFEPLLDVEVFRQCFDRIKPAVDRFEEDYQLRNLELAVQEERVRERQDSQAALDAQAAEVAGLEERRDALAAALAQVQARKEQLEARAAALAEAARLRMETQQQCGLLAQKRDQAASQVQAARSAAEALTRLEPAYRAWLAAEAQVKQLRERQDQQRRLEAQRASAAQRQAERAARAQAALERAGLFQGQRAAKDAERLQLEREHEALQARLEQGRDAAQAAQEAARDAEQALAVLGPFSAGLAPALARQQRALAQILGLSAELDGWDPAALTAAREQSGAADRQVQALTSHLAGLRERHRSLAEQLREIGSGVCPFLKEQCRQFDPAKVQADLGRLDDEIQLQTAAAGPAGAAAGTARNRLAALERTAAALDGQRVQLGERSSEFHEAQDTLLPAPVRRAAERLGAWIPLPPFPAWP
ncbi:MAG: SMC family ATPase, partial [Holophaga sp.]|nr:SMC family ATPase [Holophaga sp.]